MWMFLLNSILLGIGLAMDAFSVSLANGLSEPEMGQKKMIAVAGVYAGFQFLMPMTGWLCVHAVASQFRVFQRFIPWIALILLAWIGGKMLWEGVHHRKEQEHKKSCSPWCC